MRPVPPIAILAALLAECGAGQHGASTRRPRTVRAHTEPRTSPSAGARRPHAPARPRHAPGRPQALVTDESQGLLAVVDLASATARRFIGVRGDPQYVAAERGIALVTSPSAGTATLLQGNPLRVVKVVHGFATPRAVALAPDGRHAYVTDDARGTMTVFRARDHRPLFRTRVGPPPQHIAFAGPYVYLTSGYGSTIEQVSTRTGRVMRRARSPYGSFELAAANGFVSTASLLDGRLAIYTPRLKLLRVVKLGPATRDVEIANP